MKNIDIEDILLENLENVETAIPEKVVTVTGITMKGKNRIREHGDQWFVMFQDGEKVLLKSVKDDYWKWLAPDFEIKI